MRQVTVLGSCGAFPEPGRACSGFAVDWDGFRLVLDLGYATLPRLLAHWPDGALDRLAGLEPDVDLTAVFDPHPLPGGYRAGPFELTGVPLPHFVPNAGIRLQ